MFNYAGRNGMVHIHGCPERVEVLYARTGKK